MKRISACLLLVMSACRCGDEKKGEVSSLPESAAEIFELLFADRKPAKIDAPLEAIPGELELVAASPDPEAWRAWAVEQPYVKRAMQTPLFQELRMSRAYLAFDGLQHQAAQAASLAGTPSDRAALWKGPTAVGLELRDDLPPAVLLVKSIDEKEGAVLRFAAAFAMVSRKPIAETDKKEVSGVEIRRLDFRDESISFAVFENLLIAGNSAPLVEKAVALAMKDGEDPAAKDPLFPRPLTPGVHVRARAPAGSPLQLFGIDALGVSFVADASAPAIVRRPGAEAASTALLRYAPQAVFFALATEAAPSGAMLKTLRERLGATDRLMVGQVDVEKEIAAALKPGAAVILGATASGEAPPTPAGLIAFAHGSDPAALEPNVRKLLGDVTGKQPERTILGESGGAILLDASGPSAAITKDALLFALDPERLRSAVAAGTGKAPSLADRKGIDLAGNAGGLYLDLDRAASFLNAFYAKALENDGGAPWSEAQQVLGPTFAALGSGGAAFAKMETKDKTAEGTLRVVP